MYTLYACTFRLLHQIKVKAVSLIRKSNSTSVDVIYEHFDNLVFYPRCYLLAATEPKFLKSKPCCSPLFTLPRVSLRSENWNIQIAIATWIYDEDTEENKKKTASGSLSTSNKATDERICIVEQIIENL